MVALLAAFTIIPVTADYPTFHANNERTGAVDGNITFPIEKSGTYNQYRTLSSPLASQGVYSALPIIGPNLDNNLVQNRKLSDAGSIEGSPAVHGSRIFYPTTNGTNAGVYCVDLDILDILWSQKIPDGGSVSGITIYDNKIYAGGGNGILYCLDENTGDILHQTGKLDDGSWTIMGVSKQTGLSSTPLVYDNTVYVTTQNPARLPGFSLDLSQEICNISLAIDGQANISVFSSPALYNNIIYTSGGPGLVAVNPISKEITHNFTADGPVGTPAVNNSVVYFTTATTTYAVDATDLTKKWSVQKAWVTDQKKETYATYALATTPAIKNGFVVVNEVSGYKAYAEGGTSAETKWTWAPALSSSSILGSFLVTSPNSPVIAAGPNIESWLSKSVKNNNIESGSGKTQWNNALLSDVKGESVVYVTYLSNTNSGGLLGLDLHTGKDGLYGGYKYTGTAKKTAGTAVKLYDVTTSEFYPTTSSPAVLENNPAVSRGAVILGNSRTSASLKFEDTLLILGYSNIVTLGSKTHSVLPENFGKTVDNQFVPYATPLGTLLYDDTGLTVTATRDAGLHHAEIRIKWCQ